MTGTPLTLVQRPSIDNTAVELATQDDGGHLVYQHVLFYHVELLRRRQEGRTF